MGYYMKQKDSKFTIKKENTNKVFEAIKSLRGEETCDDHFAWVSYHFYNATNLEEILREWRWNPEMDDFGNVVDLEFMGEKFGDDKMLFDVIAPYVESGSFIEMSGEDGDLWKWLFVDKKCREVKGKVVYEYEE